MNTQLYTSNFNGTINLTRWIFPKSRSNFYINGSFGLGFAYYTYDVTPASQAFPSNKYGLAVSFPATLSLEYNFSRPVAIGLKAMYRFFNKDDLEGITRLNYKGVTNDGIAAVSLYLRYKFKAVQKHHLRNMTMDYFDPDEGLAYAKVLRKDFEGLKFKVDSLEKKVNSLEGDLALIRKLPEGMTIIQKGVAIKPMNGTSTPENLSTSPIISVKPSIATQSSLNQITKIEFDSVEFASIYFDSNQFLLDKSALNTLTKIANKLIEDPQLKIKINGYCDDTGDIAYNNRLSKLRADNVKDKLVVTWDIAPDRIVAVGMGKALSRKPNTPYRPNRRCDFFLSK
jgi:outer membrane protein OmpA-like peptidoglycan-associated protein